MTDDEAPAEPSAGDDEDPGGEPPRTTNLAVVAAAIILIGLVVFALYRRAHPAGAPAGVTGAPEAGPAPGTPITAVVPYHLTPEASIVAERYRCVCGCGDLLNVCTCNKTPGSNDMKRHLQDLVNRKLAPEQIDQEMVARFGPATLLGSAPAAPAPTPAPKKTPSRRTAVSRRAPG